MRLNNLSIRSKLFLAFTVIIAIIVVIGWTGYRGLVKSNRDIENVVACGTQIDAIMETKFALAREQQLIMELLFAESEGILKRHWQEHLDIAREFETYLTALLDGAKTEEGTIYPTEDPILREAIEAARENGNKDVFIRVQSIYDLCLYSHKLRNELAALEEGSADYAKVKADYDQQQEILGILDDQADMYAGMTIENLDKVEGVFQEQIIASRQSAAATVSRSNTTIVWVLMLGLLLAAAVCYLLSNNVSKPLYKLTRIAQAISTGDVQQSFHLDREDEVGKLSAAFETVGEMLRNRAHAAREIARGNMNAPVKVLSDADELGQSMVQMRDELTTRGNATQAAIAEAQARVSYLNNLSLPVHVVDKDMRVQFMNKAAAAAVGLSAEASTGKKCYELFKNPHCKTGNCALARAMKLKKTVTDETVVNLNGTEMTIRYTGSPLFDEQGQVVGAMEQIVDISGIKEVIDQVNQVAEKLGEGELDQRVRLVNLDGDYARLVNSFNGAIDNIMEPLNEALSCLDSMSRGDLSVRMQGDYQGDHGRMKMALNQTLDSLNLILQQVNASVEQVSNGSGQMSGASQTLSQGAAEQASTLEEISASVTEIAAKAKLNGEHARAVNKMSEETRRAAAQGNEQMTHMLEAMEDINESSEQISNIIKVIDEIAFQTNLLALNAAVEAARAGVHGKGFAVVAEEVRSLAQRSARAARETTELIGDSVVRVSRGADLARVTAEALTQIREQVNRVSGLITEMSNASQEQSAGIEQITLALDQVGKVVQSNTASSEETAAASEELRGQAEGLAGMLQQFSLTAVTRREVLGLEDRETDFTPAPARPAAPEISFEPDDFGGEDAFGAGDASDGDEAPRINLDDDDFFEL
ncbi:MAG: PAS domain-containing protein [Calditrichaeota bacterium]|nr:PAS domain-containing protein [Calditrichota bacterium]